MTLKARAQAVKRNIGSRTLPNRGLVKFALLRASLSNNMAEITAFISPLTPPPLLLNTLATRATYAGAGLLVTNR